MKFITKNSSHSTLYVGYREKYVEGKMNTKFIDLQTVDINWKAQIEQMIPKLNVACYAVRLTLHIGYINTAISIYYAYFRSIIKYGIILGGNSSNSGKIFHFTQENLYC